MNQVLAQAPASHTKSLIHQVSVTKQGVRESVCGGFELVRQSKPWVQISSLLFVKCHWRLLLGPGGPAPIERHHTQPVQDPSLHAPCT